jgi:3-oxoacyl-(acyl-carrier-protein) synthase
VITGLGLTSAAGAGVEYAWNHLLSGETALGPIQGFDPRPWGLDVAGEVRALPRRPDLDRAFQLLDLAVDEALADAGWVGDNGTEASADLAVVLGTCQGAIEGARGIHRAYAARPVPAGSAADRHAFAEYRPGRGTERIAERLGATGPLATLGMVCVSSSVATLHATELLRRGEASRALAGGFEAFSPFVFTGFQCIGALAKGPLRPFDHDRDGTVLGEGAALLCLETLSSARARGARIRAEVLGGGVAADAFHMTAPDPQGGGLERAIRHAFREAGVGPADIDYISAHGTGTPFNDQMEFTAFSRVFSELEASGRTPPLSSIKAIFGHTLGAAGALDALLCVLALERGILPPTVSLTRPIAAGAWDFVPGRARSPERPLRTVLSTNSAFGGNNSALVLRRWESR